MAPINTDIKTDPKLEVSQPEKKGLHIMKYVVPWWVVVVVVLLVLYLAYDQGYLASVIGKPEKKMISFSPNVKVGQMTGGAGLDTPAQLRELFGR